MLFLPCFQPICVHPPSALPKQGLAHCRILPSLGNEGCDCTGMCVEGPGTKVREKNHILHISCNCFMNCVQVRFAGQAEHLRCPGRECCHMYILRGILVNQRSPRLLREQANIASCRAAHRAATHPHPAVLQNRPSLTESLACEPAPPLLTGHRNRPFGHRKYNGRHCR